MPVWGDALFLLLACGGLVKVALWKSETDNVVRALRKAHRKSIESFDEAEPGKIVGVLSYVGEPLQSPLTGRTCGCYEIRVEEYKSLGNAGLGRWQTVIHEIRGHEFMIEDGTGRAIIDPSNPDGVIEIDHRSASGDSDKPTFRAREYLESHGISHRGRLFDKTLRYREGILERGETVAVMGRATREPDPDAAGEVTGYRDGPPTRLRFRGTRKTPLFLSDSKELLS